MGLRDGYFVDILCNYSDVETYFKLEESIRGWLEEEKIYIEGKIIKQPIITIDRFSELDVIDTNNDGTYELVGKQYLSIISHTATVGYIKSILKYDKSQNKWMVIELECEALEISL